MPFVIAALVIGGLMWWAAKGVSGEPDPPTGYQWPPPDGAHMPRSCWLSLAGWTVAALRLMRLGYLDKSFQISLVGTDTGVANQLKAALAVFANNYGAWTQAGDFGASEPQYDTADSIAYNLLSDVYAQQFGNGPPGDIQYQYNPNPSSSTEPCPPFGE